MSADHPERVAMLLQEPLSQPDHRLQPARGVDLAGAEAVPDAAPVHEIGEEGLRNQPKPVAGEMRMIRRADDAAATARRNRNAVGPAATDEGPRDLGRTKIAAAEAGKDLVARSDLLDRPLAPVGHRHLG